jgi:hypothetical protein
MQRQKYSPSEYAAGLTEWLKCIVHDRDLTDDARVASEFFAERDIRERLYLEALSKRG